MILVLLIYVGVMLTMSGFCFYHAWDSFNYYKKRKHPLFRLFMFIFTVMGFVPILILLTQLMEVL